MSIIKTKHLSYHYIRHDEEGNVEGEVPAVKDVNLSVEPGEFIAILGHNGSGKSTLAKHFNALLLPSEGCIVVDGMDTADENHTWDVRSTAGMVFQNPDNQIIGQVVEEDVGFGPENLGVPTKEIWERVEESLKAVGMYEYRKYSPNKLSGGQKQRVSIAGVLAMHPKCIVLDEPTAMLDPNGRKDVIRAARALNDVENVTIILITHYMEEVIYADRVFVMDEGKVVMQGTPREIFSQVERLKHLRLDVPQVTLLAYELQKSGLKLLDGILTAQELTEELKKLCAARSGWFFSIRSISCLKRMYLRMSAMDPKTSGWSRERSSGVQKRHWSWWVFRKNFSDSPRLSFPADKNGEWQLQVCLQWSRIFWCWMSRQQDLIRRAGTKY